MNADRISSAFKRIEDALVRIERAGAESLRVQSVGDPDLAEQHEALRATVRANIAELDTLIGRLEG
ncbi:hypothetical protein [Qipengyuania spongiae]|uniref:Uncharacterized protein n=1 Tax=Qipengyuania spongiae TaxID=2909673 RepID=A0ABY5SY00_9SPHN|nr:hypothetical protein [Qipengyuania spongiae]UVI39035.1 hypothetical protein L1F33_12465 [Qipengyuania spongiae]